MSDMSTLLASAIASLATTKGDSLTYCATLSGSYTALTGFIIHVDRVQPVTMNDSRHTEEQEETATVKGPSTPALVRGYFVKDVTNGNKVWYVEAVKFDQQQIARCRRVNQLDATPDRAARR